MAQTPLVSVIIPVYNGAATIGETIASVRSQTLTDWELIVVDDGSTDGTAAAVRDLAATTGDQRITVISIANGGVSAARNVGAARSRGTYLSFIDADDLWTVDKLEAQVRLLRSRPGAAVAYSWVDCVDGDGLVRVRRGGYSLGVGALQRKLTLIDTIESGSNVLVTRSAFEAVGGFDETLTHGEDWDLWLRLAARFAYAVVPAPQVLYRQRPGSASANVWRMERQSLKIIDRAIARLGDDSTLAGPISEGDRAALGRRSVTNRYRILAFEALDGPRSRRRALTALRYVHQVLRRDPSLWRRPWRSRTIALLTKLALLIGLPHRLSGRWLGRDRFKKAEDLLLWTIETQP
ncbi:MAG: hypothetical protein Fur0042_30580 [Cyanophyceae cyanobacterium]